MTLDKAALKAAIEDLGPQDTRAHAAAAWATAMGDYAAGIVPASTTVGAAKAALETALTHAFGQASAAPEMETAFAAFAATLGGGMTGYTPTPPPGEVGFATRFATNRSSASVAATAVADAIDDWLTTGSSELIAPPNTVVTWS